MKPVGAYIGEDDLIKNLILAFDAVEKQQRQLLDSLSNLNGYNKEAVDNGLITKMEGGLYSARVGEIKGFVSAAMKRTFELHNDVYNEAVSQGYGTKVQGQISLQSLSYR